MGNIDKVQAEARARWELAGRKGLIAGATGTGKSKIALDRIAELFEIHAEKLNVLVVVPTEKLRDVGWPDDAKKWGVNIVYDLHVQGVCYVSADKIPSQHFHLIVLDEAHHITELSNNLFETVTYDEVMALTATRPGKHNETERTKSNMLDRVAPLVFEYPVEQAVQDGVVNDFQIHVVQLSLDDSVKNIKAGGKKKSWMQTELDAYTFLDSQLTKLRIELSKKDVDYNLCLLGNCDEAEKLKKEREQLFIRHQIAIGNRARFIYNLPSKTQRARDILANIIEKRPGQRTLVFCGSIDQSKVICGTQVYNSKSSDEYFTKFMNEEIDYLGVVNAVDEGQNIPNLDFGLVVQASSVGRRLIQRLGRIIRKRVGVTAHFYILMVKDTVDEKWVESALEGIDPSRIIRYNETK